MTKTKQLDKLFQQWESEIPGYKNLFVKDGIINEKIWNETSPKILFIAKEPNHYENPRAGDFREDWTKGDSKYPFAYRIAEWAFGILEGFKLFREIEYQEHLYDIYLQKIAFMNIKKLGGGSSTNLGNLLTHIETKGHLEYLRKQIGIIDPEIIVLGLSWGASASKLKELILPGITEQLTQCGYSIEVAKLGKAKIIDFYHPSSRTGPSAAYSLLQNVFYSKVFKNLI